MEMLLMGACLALLGIAVACAAFGAAVQSQEPAREAEAERVQEAVPARFFVDQAPVLPPAPALPLAPGRTPIKVLLWQIESHVRLEHAAAESFVFDPSVAQLHSRTTSPLLN